MADGKALKVKGIGKITPCSSKGKITSLNDVQFVPNLAHNLLSVGQMMDSGFDVEFTRGVCNIKYTESKTKITQVCMTSNRLFLLEADDIGFANVAQSGEKISNIWHKRYRHISMKKLKLLSKREMALGLPNISSVNPCKYCSQGKQARAEFPKGEAKRGLAPMEMIPADLIGPISTPCIGGNLYFILFTDDFTRYSWVYFIKKKSETFH